MLRGRPAAHERQVQRCVDVFAKRRAWSFETGGSGPRGPPRVRARRLAHPEMLRMLPPEVPESAAADSSAIDSPMESERRDAAACRRADGLVRPPAERPPRPLAGGLLRPPGLLARLSATEERLVSVASPRPSAAAPPAQLAGGLALLLSSAPRELPLLSLVSEGRPSSFVPRELLLLSLPVDCSSLPLEASSKSSS
mmetsp:Transcript_14456/g.46317  ORF Transcript_14456/g.46317 Transcript_14456/m.46317 type:complete len:197 (-) Transcript_14456:717-1307(-)